MHRATLRLAVVCCLATMGCQQLNLQLAAWESLRLPFPSTSAPSSDEDDLFSAPDEVGVAVETNFIGDYGNVAGLNVITLTGVGLVTGLDGTGGDPPPSMYRERLLDEMRRRGVANPNAVLASRDTAVVAIKAYLPPLIRKGERFDIEVALPDTGEATSLRGGYLLEAYLAEQKIVPGRGILDGHDLAKAEGPILISTGEGDEESLAGVVRRGRVLGGGRSLVDRNMVFQLRNDFRTARNSKRLAARIGQRFYSQNEHGIREPLAEAKTDQQIELKIHPRYNDNFPRYVQVVKAISFNETSIAERNRMQLLKDRLNNPPTSERAAIELEAIGPNAIPILKQALNNPSREVRFHAATALAYLGRDEGLPQLTEAARLEPAFRVYALAAIATLESSDAPRHLRELMNEKSAELRYGAFRALSKLDPTDYFIAGRRLNDAYTLHALETTGDPLVHLTHKAKQEIVLFGTHQRLVPPFVLQAGNQIHVSAPPGSSTVTVSRYDRDVPVRKEVSPRLVDVIEAAAQCGATYPDIAQMLVQAEKGRNLEGRLEIDALPRAGRQYVRPKNELDQFAGRAEQTRIGRASQAPNLFAADGDPREDDPGSENETPRAAPREADDDSSGDTRASADPGERPKPPSRSELLLREETPWYDVRRYFLDPKIR